MNIYDEEIEFLTAHPEEIIMSWYGATGLFRSFKNDKSTLQHCPTECKSSVLSPYISFSPGIDERIPQFIKDIQKDERIPANCDGITIESLPAFKEYQERWDVINNSN
jgi:hypothetical protein